MKCPVEEKTGFGGWVVRARGMDFMDKNDAFTEFDLVGFWSDRVAVFDTQAEALRAVQRRSYRIGAGKFTDDPPYDPEKYAVQNVEILPVRVTEVSRRRIEVVEKGCNFGHPET